MDNLSSLTFTPAFFAVAIPAVIYSGISKGGFGGGAAFISAAILALLLDPGTALGVMLPLLMLIDVTAVRQFWKRWNWADARPLLMGSIPGLVLGTALYKLVEPDFFRVMIGVIALVVVIWHLLQRSGAVRARDSRLPAWVGMVSGAVMGFTSFVSHAGGPAAAAFLLSQKLDKTAFQATMTLVFLITNTAKFVPYAFLGLFTWETVQASLALAPFALLGTWLGVRAHHIVPERTFFAITYVLLAVTGVRLIWVGLT